MTRHGKRQARLDPKEFYPKKCVNFDKSEFATKQRKMYFTTSMSKTRELHIYRGKNYVIRFFVPNFNVKVKIFKLKAKSFTPKKRKKAKKLTFATQQREI